MPPPARVSPDPRMGDRFEPVPEPYLKSIPSVFASPRIDSIESSTELMKQAEHCGAGSKPQLNQTGELNAPRCPTRIALSSAVKMAWSFSLAKYLPSFAHLVMVSTTRPIIWRMLDSRSGVPCSPRKYLSATMSVACCDQLFGASTSFCSKTVPPLLSLMAARRVSHSISSNGLMPSRLNRRSNVSPGALLPGFGALYRRHSAAGPDSSCSRRPGALVCAGVECGCAVAAGGGRRSAARSQRAGRMSSLCRARRRGAGVRQGLVSAVLPSIPRRGWPAAGSVERGAFGRKV